MEVRRNKRERANHSQRIILIRCIPSKQNNDIFAMRCDATDKEFQFELLLSLPLASSLNRTGEDVQGTGCNCILQSHLPIAGGIGVPGGNGLEDALEPRPGDDLFVEGGGGHCWNQAQLDWIELDSD